MKPNKRQAGPDRGRGEPERPESRGQETPQEQRLEKEAEILGGRETEAGPEGTDPDDDREG